jgi:phosphatidylserine decarboxylase
MAVILVGAMLVGSIKTVWSGPPHGKKVVQQSYPVGQIKLDRGEELGHFIMGSTVILIFQDKKLMWAPDLQSLSPVLMGQAIAKALLP